jgi:8-oxo-dGTP pyrophosphatase MutT (NUDIX family)
MRERPPQESPDFPNAFYRVTAKGLCVRDGQVLLLHDFTGRSDEDPSPEWELPGGGLEFGENFTDALKREIKEETGLAVKWMEEKPTYIWTTKHASGRGMKYFWICTVIFRFDVLDLNFTPTEECRAIKFFSKEDLQADFENLGSQVKPLAEAFNPEDFYEK